MRQHMGKGKELFVVRTGYDTLAEHQLGLLREAVGESVHVITRD